MSIIAHKWTRLYRFHLTKTNLFMSVTEDIFVETESLLDILSNRILHPLGIFALLILAPKSLLSEDLENEPHSLWGTCSCSYCFDLTCQMLCITCDMLQVTCSKLNISCYNCYMLLVPCYEEKGGQELCS